MAPHPTVGIDNYLPSGQPGVALRSANHKTSCWIDQIPRLRVDPLGRDHSFYDSLNQSFPDLLVLYVGSMLGGDHDCVHSNRSIALVFNRNLGLGVWTQPRKLAGFA